MAVPRDRLLSQAARDNGRQLFRQHCALCHGVKADGRGVRRNLSTPAADFTDRIWREGTSPREVFFVIREGRKGTPMAAWKVLSEAQTWDLVSYILAIPEEGP